MLGWYNWARFGDPLESGYKYAPDFFGFGGSPAAGVSGLLFSPGRSVFLYSPILIAALVGLVLLWREHRALAATLVAIIVANLAFYGIYPAWWGGWGWGPRYLVPTMPFLILPLLPLLQRWHDLPRTARRAIYGLAAAGVVVQVLDISLDFSHQLQLLVESGVKPPDAQAWTVQHSGIWRHAGALVGLLIATFRFFEWPVPQFFPEPSFLIGGIVMAIIIFVLIRFSNRSTNAPKASVHLLFFVLGFAAGVLNVVRAYEGMQKEIMVRTGGRIGNKVPDDED